MDFLKNAVESATKNQGEGQPPAEGQAAPQGGLDGLLGGLKNQVNSAAGGGAEGEKNEDYLDKGVDFVQEKFLNQGPQDNESAVEQAKDEQISDFIRKQYKDRTGNDIPIADKPTTFE